MRWLRDWLASLDDDALRRCRFVRKPHGPITDPAEREGRRVCETEAQRLNRISKTAR